jgi:hypothetical protein
MKNMKSYLHFWTVLIMSFALMMFAGCDSGKEAIDDVTGNKAVKQYQKSKKDVDKIVDKQSEKLKSTDDKGKEESDDLDEE